MEFKQVSYSGPPVDDPEVLERLPKGFAGVLRQRNGFIQFQGGLHVRGACRNPSWHSLRDAWLGMHAFHRLYPVLTVEDIPFAEDCLGDQFVLREQQVWRLAAETGELEPLGVGLKEFFIAAQADPDGFLSLEPLRQFRREGGELQPGQLLAAFPPFCFKESAAGVTLKAIDAAERRRFLADLAAQLRQVDDGEQVRLEWRDAAP